MKLMLLKNDQPQINALIKSRNFRGAIQALSGQKRVYENSHPLHRAAYYHILGICYSKIGTYDKADECFDRALAISPGNTKIKLEMVDSLLQRGQLIKAKNGLLELSEQLDGTYTGTKRRINLLAGRYFKLIGEYASARAYYQEVVKLDDPPSKHVLDINLMDTFLNSAAGPYYRNRGIHEYGNHLFSLDLKAKPFGNLSIIFLENCAKDAISRHLRLDCLVHHAECAMYLGAYAEGYKHNQIALQQDSEHPRLLAIRMRLHLKMGKHKEALEFYESYKPLISSDPAGATKLASAFIEAGYAEIGQQIAKIILDSGCAIKPSTLQNCQRLLESSVTAAPTANLS